ncbi:MAG: ribosome small subunit-dependent GTPase A [Actinomycetia bacterium]|nr:ribosome small subunit-dependent GTPase A [Actinomycetes bacterium]
MSQRHDRLDEDDVRVRPGKGKSRARSKIRPEHQHASEALVTAVDRGRFTAVLDDDPARLVYAVKAREIGRKGVVVGDRVDLVGDITGGGDALARIVRRQPRMTVLRRSADDNDPVERVVVANAEQLAIVVAAADPEPRPRLVDRALIAALDGGLKPAVIVTKTDLASADALVERYSPLDITVLTRSKGDPLDALRDLLEGRTTVLLGHSGVGKSTLVNALVPAALRATGLVNSVTGRGRHTSTSAVAFPLKPRGWVVDTPGIRSFGLAHVDLDRFMRAFPDLEVGTRDCPRGCAHTDAHCALDAFVANGAADPTRLASLRRLLSSRSDTGNPYPTDQTASAPE